jgi:hypothetical protein
MRLAMFHRCLGFIESVGFALLQSASQRVSPRFPSLRVAFRPVGEASSPMVFSADG